METLNNLASYFVVEMLASLFPHHEISIMLAMDNCDQKMVSSNKTNQIHVGSYNLEQFSIECQKVIRFALLQCTI